MDDPPVGGVREEMFAVVARVRRAPGWRDTPKQCASASLASAAVEDQRFGDGAACRRQCGRARSAGAGRTRTVTSSTRKRRARRYKTRRTTHRGSVVRHDHQARHARKCCDNRPEDFVVEIAAGRGRRRRLPDLVLLTRDQLLGRLARHRPHRDGDAAWLDHPHGQLIIELVERENRFIGASDACTAARPAGANLFASLADRARAASASANARS